MGLGRAVGVDCTRKDGGSCPVLVLVLCRSGAISCSMICRVFSLAGHGLTHVFFWLGWVLVLVVLSLSFVSF